MSTEILIVFILLLLNAFFALSEMAIVSSSKPLLRQYAKQGKGAAKVALHLAENSGRFLSTVQIGITLVGILAGAYGGATIAQKLTEPFNAIPWIAPHGEAIAVTLVVALITYASVVIGELVPKQLALNNSERFAMLIARPMALLSLVCTPIVWVLEMSASLLMRIIGIKPKDEGVTETEIKAVIAEGVASGAIEDEEHDVIRRVIRLGDRDVTSIMTHRKDIRFIDINDDYDTVAARIVEVGHSRYPVIKSGDITNVLGIVKAKEILAAKNDASFSVANYLHRILYVNEKSSCLKALNLLRTKSLHIAAVIDEYGSFEGIFTTSDLMEAIVGIMPSNYDSDEEPRIAMRNDGSWLVDGLTPIDEIHMAIGIEEIDADADYQTIAGFALKQLKETPRKGISFEFAGHRFEIMDMDGFRIDQLLIEKIPTPS